MIFVITPCQGRTIEASGRWRPGDVFSLQNPCLSYVILPARGTQFKYKRTSPLRGQSDYINLEVVD
jgi:hypothetical protein